ncbi:hypothetical protein DF111_01525 [Burkholderia stagnalis]|uniref:hypothetical protein n=1 Tax=Burkholderia stagnalis TaxID=1503054 RepID=UPI000F5EE93B|nr:hypothetical protein [Burkholderia stagnalis]RQY60820.1 hypothetical protein DF111_01525 [Burkholderia stagnalis]
MNLIEVFELAARAAGWESRRHKVRDVTGLFVRTHIGANWQPFDPMKSKADAFDLAAAARIDTTHHADYVAAYAGAGAFRQFSHDSIDARDTPAAAKSERERATCRAITECAAQIGRDVGAPWWRTL